MTVFNAFFSAVASFFSVWLFCLLQIIPFFIAFTVGATLTSSFSGTARRVNEALSMAIVSFVGFMFIFTAMGMTTTALSKAIFGMLSLGNQLGGVVIGVIGLYLLGALTMDFRKSAGTAAIRYGSAFLFGVAVALAYRPCVTPALTNIYKIASNPATSGQGGVLLIAYSFGIASVITTAALTLSWAIVKTGSIPLEKVSRKLCGAVLLVIAGLILSGHMTTYKSFLVGRFVPDTTAVEPAMRRD